MQIKMYLFLTIIILNSSVLAQMSNGIGMASDLSNSIESKIYWTRALTTKGDIYITKYSFSLSDVGQLNIFLSHNKKTERIYYRLDIESSEYPMTDGILKLSEMTEDNNTFSLKKESKYSNLFKIRISPFSKKKEHFKLLNLYTDDYFALYFNLE